MQAVRFANSSDEDFLRDIRNSNRNWFLNKEVIGVEGHTKWFNKVLISNNVLIFIIEFKGERIGTISLYNICKDDKSAELGRFVILPEYRGNHFGSEALYYVLTRAKCLGLERIYLSVTKDNLTAYSLYKNRGFCQCMNQATNNIIMEKFLNTL